jgi:methanogenic corrinoid protein MtbC1
MLSGDYDPYQVLNDLAKNQVAITNEHMRLTKTLQDVLYRLESQQQLIDTMMRTIEATNKTNEMIIQHLFTGDAHGKARNN